MKSLVNKAQSQLNRHVVILQRCQCRHGNRVGGVVPRYRASRGFRLCVNHEGSAFHQKSENRNVGYNMIYTLYIHIYIHTWYIYMIYTWNEMIHQLSSAHILVKSPPISGAKRLPRHPNARVGAWRSDLLILSTRAQQPCAAAFFQRHTRCVERMSGPVQWMGGPLDSQAKHSDVRGPGWLQLEEHSIHWWIWLNFEWSSSSSSLPEPPGS